MLQLELIKDNGIYIPTEKKYIDQYLKKKSGLYLFYNNNFELMYIGKAGDIRSRVDQHIKGKTHTKDIKHNFKYFRYIEINNIVDMDIYETYYINLLKPKLNIDKVYTYKSDIGLNKYKSEEEINRIQIYQSELDKSLEEFFV